MKKTLIALLAATTAITSLSTAGVAAAQPGGYSRDRDRDGRPDQYDRHDDRRDSHRYYGGRYGYNGYHGRWRTGQRYTHWRDRGYVVEDWRAYNLPPPRPGYRYYRDDNGDVVMAAIASGVIGLIIGGALADHGHDHYRH